MTMKKLSVFMVSLVLLFSLTAVYATTILPNGLYDSDDVAINLWKDGSTFMSNTYSMADNAIVQGSQELEVTSSGGTLTFDIQAIDIEYFGMTLQGNLTALSVSFDGGSTYTDAVVSSDTVTLQIPYSELTAEKHVYPAKVDNDVAGITMPSDVEFYINLGN